jgi:hypothetical protein
VPVPLLYRVDETVAADGNSGSVGRIAVRERPICEVRAFARDS